MAATMQRQLGNRCGEVAVGSGDSAHGIDESLVDCVQGISLRSCGSVACGLRALKRVADRSSESIAYTTVQRINHLLSWTDIRWKRQVSRCFEDRLCACAVRRCPCKRDSPSAIVRSRESSTFSDEKT